jgi:acid phosphatase
MQKTARFVPLLAAVGAVGCASQHSAEDDYGVAWVNHSAEFEALARQTYATATRDLDGLIADTSFSALPSQRGSESLPPAVILDVDETVVSNVEFQLTYEPPFENWKLDRWNRDNPARAIAGVRDFVAAARAKGVTVFFVTNRPCEPESGAACPQQQTTLDDIAEVGIETDDAHLLLAYERPEWTREKRVRRELIAETYRVIMLFGDDLGDFIPCVRTTAVPPCTVAANKADRQRLVREHGHLWGNGWYVLPNPMHGSWTSARD